jgi:hypothetical protein
MVFGQEKAAHHKNAADCKQGKQGNYLHGTRRRLPPRFQAICRKCRKRGKRGIKAQCDSGYQGILRLHVSSETPKKKPKGGELTPEEKADNRRISRERILIENINAKIKVFKVVANKYRSRRNRFKLRMSLICGICNFELLS